jgi:hypothetical protein
VEILCRDADHGAGWYIVPGDGEDTVEFEDVGLDADGDFDEFARAQIVTFGKSLSELQTYLATEELNEVAVRAMSVFVRALAMLADQKGAVGWSEADLYHLLLHRFTVAAAVARSRVGTEPSLLRPEMSQIAREGLRTRREVRIEARTRGRLAAGCRGRGAVGRALARRLDRPIYSLRPARQNGVVRGAARRAWRGPRARRRVTLSGSRGDPPRLADEDEPPSPSSSEGAA